MSFEYTKKIKNLISDPRLKVKLHMLSNVMLPREEKLVIISSVFKN